MVSIVFNAIGKYNVKYKEMVSNICVENTSNICVENTRYSIVFGENVVSKYIVD